MNVRDNGKLSVATDVPQRPEVPAVEPNNSRVERVGIKVVVRHIVHDSCTLFDTVAK
jgi:hypothetical protein